MGKRKVLNENVQKGVFEVFSLTFRYYIIPMWLMCILILIESGHLILLPLTYIIQNIYSTSTLNSLIKLLMKYSVLTTSSPIYIFELLSIVIWILIIGFALSLTIAIYYKYHTNKEEHKLFKILTPLVIQGLIITEKLIAIPISIFIQILRNNFISYDAIELEGNRARNIEYIQPFDSGTYLYMTIFCFSLATLLVIIVLLLISFNFFYDLNPRTKVNISYQKRIIHFIVFLLKIYLILIWALDPTFTLALLHLLGCLVFGGTSLILRIYSPPLKFLLLFHLATASVVFLILLYITAFFNLIHNSNLYLMISILFLLSNFIPFIYIQIGNWVMEEQIVKVTSYTKGIYMFERLFQLFHKDTISDVKYAQFMSLTHQHYKICPNPNCGSSMVMEELDKKRDLLEYFQPAIRNLTQKRIVGLFSCNPALRHKGHIFNPIHLFVNSIFQYLRANYNKSRFLQILQAYFEFYIEEHTCKLALQLQWIMRKNII